MSRFSMRKTLTGIAIAALATSGLVMTAGTASADATHPSAATVNSSNVRITKSIVGDGEVAPGGKVTVRTVISTTGHPERYVDQFVDRYPATFKYIQGTATVNAWHLIGGQKTESVTPSVDTAARTVNVPSTGWLISPTGSKTVTIEAQYLVADDAPIGSYQEMSSSIGISTFNTEQNISGVYAKIRAKNPGEAAASGSADLASALRTARAEPVRPDPPSWTTRPASSPTSSVVSWPTAADSPAPPAPPVNTPSGNVFEGGIESSDSVPPSIFCGDHTPSRLHQRTK